MANQKVPITGSVLQWAIEQSGLSDEEVAKKCGVKVETLQAWIGGAEKPGVTNFKKLGQVLKRPPSTLLLPNPPDVQPAAVQFRHPPDHEHRGLNPKERLRLREATRLQRGLHWVLEGLGDREVELPTCKTTTPPEKCAARLRKVLGVSVTTQKDWKNEYEAAREWRRVLEELGITVLFLPMGDKSSRGFSIWDPLAPVIAVNTAWNVKARIFTMFHELGHLVTKTSSVCDVTTYRHSHHADEVERWCEAFAAAVLLPWNDVEEFLIEKGWDGTSKFTSVSTATSISNKFKVSLKAAALRLINGDVAGWDLYRQIPKTSDVKSGGGGGGDGRTRPMVRLDEYGHRTARVMLRGMSKDVLSRDDVLSFMNLGDLDLDYVEQEAV